MDVLIAIAHIFGAIIAVLLFGFITLLISEWDLERKNKQILEEAAIKLGVTVGELDNEQLSPKLLQITSDRFSSELFRNRLSDLFGVIRDIWMWLGALLQIGVLLVVIWYTLTDSTDMAVYAWVIVAIALIFWILNVLFAIASRLLTGRYPGEAKQGRKKLAEYLKSQEERVS